MFRVRDWCAYYYYCYYYYYYYYYCCYYYYYYVLAVQAAGEGSFLGAAIGDELRRQVAARDPGQQAAIRFLSRQLQADTLPVGGCVLS